MLASLPPGHGGALGFAVNQGDRPRAAGHPARWPDTSRNPRGDRPPPHGADNPWSARQRASPRRHWQGTGSPSSPPWQQEPQWSSSTNPAVEWSASSWSWSYQFQKFTG